MAFERELLGARAAAREAAAVLRSHFARGPEAWEAHWSKAGAGGDDPVSVADLEADACIAAALTARFPDDARLSEESGEGSGEGSPGRRGRQAGPGSAGAPRVWIVDPMDGTRAFVEGRPEFAVSVALVVAGRPVVAVVHQPVEDVAVWATAGGGTRRGGGAADAGEPVHVGDCARLQDAVVLASRREHARGELDAFAGRFAELRTVSSIAWKLALVACGEADLNLTTRAKSCWDVCAGDLLVHEAGGRFVTGAGTTPRYGHAQPEIPGPRAAGNATLIEALLAGGL